MLAATSALLLSLPAPATPPSGPPSAPAEEDGAWLGLDRELELLARSTSSAEWEGIGGWLRVLLEDSNDFDTSGFRIPVARVRWAEEVGDYLAEAQVELGSDDFDEAELLDVRLNWRCGEDLNVSLGQIKNPFSREFLMPLQDRTFLGRTLTAQNPAIGQRETGIELATSREGLIGDGGFHALLAVLNGEDGVFDEVKVVLRLDLDVIGRSPNNPANAGGYLPFYEGWGRQGANVEEDGTSFTLGAAVFDEGFVDDGTAVTVDGVVRMPRISFGFAAFDLGNDLPNGDTNPAVIWGTYALNENWDFGACGEDQDDPLDSQQFVAAANYFPEGGATKRGTYDTRWTLQYRCFDNDSTDFDEISLGLTIGF